MYCPNGASNRFLSYLLPFSSNPGQLPFQQLVNETEEASTSPINDEVNSPDINEIISSSVEGKTNNIKNQSNSNEAIVNLNERHYESITSEQINEPSDHTASNLKSTQNSNTGCGNSGGILSFFGLKLNKSSTRHLDRSSSGDSVDNNKSESCTTNRYTKFPLKGTQSSNLNETADSVKAVVTPDPSSSSSRSSVESHSHASSSSEVSTAPQSNSRFDISQIQLTPQTKVYSNPHRSPSRSSSKKGSSFSPSNFLSKSICSFAKKSSGSKGTSFINKRKSKSDNSLHRVDLSSRGGSSTAFSSVFGSFHGTNGGRTVTSSSQNIYNSEPGSELRLNSVQIGDHAPIHLPWTGLQSNNLSSATSHRIHQNTHNNLEDVRYVECGFQLSNRDFTLVRPTHHNFHCQRTEYSLCAPLRRRSRSLERDAGYRINPRNSLASTSCGTGSSNSSTDGISCKFIRGSNRTSSHSNFGIHQVRRCLTPEEQEVLLRNISWEGSSLPGTSDTPPPRPEKPASLRNKFPVGSPVVKPRYNSNTSSSYLKPIRKPPHIGVLPKSAPNSFSTSSDSNDSFSSNNSSSRPPSPPPRPPSTIKSDSRLISPRTRIITKKNFQSGGVISIKVQNSGSNLNFFGSEGEEFCSDTSSSADSAPFPHKKLTEDKEVDPISSQTSSAATTESLPPSVSASGSQKMSIENQGFINKPTKGWIHSDSQLAKEGVTYTVRYIGCLDVNRSMKSLDFDTRSLIAKECINQVCEAAGLKSVDRKRKVDRNMKGVLGEKPRLENAGSDVRLAITSTCLRLTSLDTGAIIASHSMPNISFASGGDATTLDFIAYVAKDPVIGRACFILECGSGLAQDVIVTIGQAFELRFKEFVQKRPPPRIVPAEDRDYYNDLPGKLPPESGAGKTRNESLNGNGNHEGKITIVRGKEIPNLTLAFSSEASVNLIDFEAPTPPAFGPTTQEKHLESLLLGPDSPTFVAVAGSSAASVGTGLGLPNSPSQPNRPQSNKDPFEMQPFTTDLPKPLSSDEQRELLETQSWFHGCITRQQAEQLVKNDGDFLVRESLTTVGQYVLTGIQDGSPKHLLLVDPSGVVRTKDQTFDNVIHLIRHHSDNCLPIISAESMVILRHPIPRGSPTAAN